MSFAIIQSKWKQQKHHSVFTIFGFLGTFFSELNWRDNKIKINNNKFLTIYDLNTEF